jgi:hypothetical protein
VEQGDVVDLRSRRAEDDEQRRDGELADARGFPT